MITRPRGILFFVLLVTSTDAIAQPLTFQRDDHSSTTSARGIASADFNRDG